MAEHYRRFTIGVTTGVRGTFVPLAAAVAFGLIIASMGHCLAIAAEPPVALRIDTTQVVHTMASGMGASWHAIGPTAYWYDGLIGQGRNNRTCRGSAFGGNPPLSNPKAWSDLLGHARWLGLDFCRVEIDLRMYEPERNRFDWDNTEMATLYRILDYCEQSGVDVLLAQMWQDVAWNAHDQINRLESAPKSIPDFAEGLGTLMEHLVNRRGYRCIRWLSVSNEPGGGWGWWWGPDGKCAALMPAIRAVRAELDRRGLTNVMIAAPDSFNLTIAGCEPNDPAIGAYALHHYEAEVPSVSLRQSADAARARGIPFLAAEFGHVEVKELGGFIIPFGDGQSAIPKSYSAQLLNAEKVLAGLAAGADGFNRWSFVNRGDLDGQWQLVRTWDSTSWDYYKEVHPEPVPYYSYGILTRFAAKQSRILAVQGNPADLQAAALESPTNNLTIIVLNRAKTERQVSCSVDGLRTERTLHKYQVTEATVSDPDYRMEPLQAFAISPANASLEDSLPAESITVYSTYKLSHTDPGISRESSGR
jgi:hypothetical protein